MSDAESASPFRSPTFIWAAVLIGILLVIGIIVVALNIVDSNRETATPAPTPASASPTPALGDDCPQLDSIDPAAEVDPYLKVDWRHTGSVAYPVSEALGPFKETKGVNECFARSRDGAALAAASLVAAGSTPGLQVAVVEERVLGSLKEERLLEAEKQANTVGADPARLTVSAFRVFNYTPERAVVEIGGTVERGSRTQYVSIITTLVWQDNDWYAWADVPSDSVSSAVPSLQGMTFWNE